MTFRSCFFHVAWWRPEVIDVFRRCSSGSVSNWELPSSTRPIRVVAPAANRSASATVVLPVPPCPTMATFRSFATSSAAIPSSVVAVPLIDDAETLEGQELVDALDRVRHRGDQRSEPAGGDRPRRHVVLG